MIHLQDPRLRFVSGYAFRHTALAPAQIAPSGAAFNEGPNAKPRPEHPAPQTSAENGPNSVFSSAPPNADSASPAPAETAPPTTSSYPALRERTAIKAVSSASRSNAPSSTVATPTNATSTTTAPPTPPTKSTSSPPTSSPPTPSTSSPSPPPTPNPTSSSPPTAKTPSTPYTKKPGIC